MTGVAEIAGRDMVRWLATRLDAVVAAEAVGPRRHVGKAGKRKCPCIVAAVALIRGRQVVHWLTGRAHAVVTAGAGTDHFQMIDTYHWLPGSWLVTTGALVRGQDVVRGLLCCSDEPTLAVAA